jgi:4-hydroxy-3-polyprenylbenzoate decarboxylase
MRIVKDKLPRLDPSVPVELGVEPAADGSAILINATRSHPYPPTSLPPEDVMRRALSRWKELGLPELQLREPWYGYELGAWTEENRDEARHAVEGRYLETGERLHRE